MSTDWLISMPAWGARCVGHFVESAVPALEAAIRYCEPQPRIRFLVHTDQPGAVRAALRDWPHEVRPVPPGSEPHRSLGNANREALAIANLGERVAFVNADMVASREVFAAADASFGAGKKLIVMAASRTIGGRPPIGAASRELLDWTMEHRHPAIIECFWNSGRTCIPWAIYFQSGENVVLHGFHLHPFAILKDRPIVFRGVTIDADLVEGFDTTSTHMVTSSSEMAFAEMSPPERVFPLVEPMTTQSVAAWAKRHATPRHRWMFQHPIAIRGDGADIGDRAVCAQIISALGVSR